MGTKVNLVDDFVHIDEKISNIYNTDNADNTMYEMPIK